MVPVGEDRIGFFLRPPLLHLDPPGNIYIFQNRVDQRRDWEDGFRRLDIAGQVEEIGDDLVGSGDIISHVVKILFDRLIVHGNNELEVGDRVGENAE